MHAYYQIFVPLLSLFLVRVDLTDIWTLRIPVRLEKVIDGDTVHVKSGNRILKVRISRIDTPEKGQPFLGHKGGGDAGMLAMDCFLRTIHGQKDFVLLMEKIDVYGRVLGELEGLSLKLVRNGCTGLYPYAEFSSRNEKSEFLRALSEARTMKRGLWSVGGYQLPKIWRKKSIRRTFKKRNVALLSHR